MTDVRTPALCALLSLLVALPLSAQEGPWRIAERTLSPPTHASEALASLLAQTPQPDPSTSRFPETAAQWRALQETVAAAPDPTPGIESAYNVSIETGERNGVTVYEVSPQQPDPAHSHRIFLHLHGGGYVLNGGPGGAAEAAMISRASGMRAVSVDYRMPPRAPFPAAVDDAVAVYRSLLEDFEPGAIGIGGTSAGAGLALAAMLQMKRLDLPLPGAFFAGTPWADLTDSSDSLHTNRGIDRVLVSYEGLLRSGAELYADGESLTNPLISPLYGDFEDMPSTILISGTRDMLLSDTVRVHRKLLAAGVEAELHVFEGLSHADYLLAPQIPESQETFALTADFLARHLD